MKRYILCLHTECKNKMKEHEKYRQMNLIFLLIVIKLFYLNCIQRSLNLGIS